LRAIVRISALAQRAMASTSQHSEPANLRVDPFECELERIRAVYARRKRELPAERYSDSNPRASIFYSELGRRILGLLQRQSLGCLSEKQVLDVGCGEGRWLRRFLDWGVAPEGLAGIDLLPDRIAVARQRCHPLIRFSCGNAACLPFADRCVDIVSCMTVFSSILSHELKVAIAGEILRVLRPGGFVLWYDFVFGNPANRDVRGIRRNELTRLFPKCEMQFERVTVFAPLGRAVASIPRFYSALAGCRVFSTHYLGCIRKQ
jgi:ubiquinone/menaquinone biosynthesis C-methylase UbiE